MDLFRALKHKRMLVVFLMGFSSGLPYLIVADNISLWLRKEGIALSVIGYLGWVTIPYTLKFLWSFLTDHYSLTRLGRRRSWILFSQLGLVAALYSLGLQNPAAGFLGIIICGTAVALLSATQDIAIDAYRVEILKFEEQGIGAALSTYGYRIGMLVASGFGVWIVSPKTWGFSFGQSFQLLASFMIVGIVATLWAHEPKVAPGAPRSISGSLLEPLRDFFTRPMAIWILGFILLYKLGDAMGGKMLSPFYVDLGYDLGELALTRKLIGLYSSFAGLAIGGIMIFRYGLYRTLWICGILQSLSTIAFSLLNFMHGAQLLPLGIVMGFEDITAGMGSAALAAFIAVIINQKFTATQLALLGSIATLGRNFFAGFSGRLIELFAGSSNIFSGYYYFYIFCALLALPGLICLRYLDRLEVFRLK